MTKLKNGFKTKILLTTGGAPIVKDAFIREISENIVAIDVAMTSKNCIVDATIGGDDALCGIAIGTDHGSSGLRKGVNRNVSTIVEFADFKGWDVYCASSNKYIICVCLVKKDATDNGHK